MQKTNWFFRLLISGLVAMAIGQGVSSPTFAREFHDRGSGTSSLIGQTASTQKRLDGIWVGVVVVGIKVQVILRVAQNPDGALSARLDVPDQGASNLFVESITIEGQVVRFQAPNLGTYQGTLSHDASEIVGELKQGSVTLPITFKRVDNEDTVHRGRVSHLTKL